MKYLKVSFLVLICSLMPLSLFAQTLNDEDTFFSYERFYSEAGLLKNAAKDTSSRQDIRDFMRNFSDGISAISVGNLEKAKTDLLKARAVWPEYFGTDFLLARIHEDMKKYAVAAEFYKSYLDKLAALSEGKYRISEPLMRGISPYGVERYNDAYTMVKNRLRDRGIDLNAVRPFYSVPGFLKFLVLFIMLGAGYIAVARGIIPYIKRRRHISHPPEGIWICKKCGADNVNVRRECEKCGEKRVE